ncbi:DUF2268 domain-containing putative Zn-dependent protease [Stenotrophomonas maltophilia]
MASVICRWIAGGLAIASLATAAQAETRARAPIVRTDDVTRFFAVMDASGGRPDASLLQRRYLQPGSDALHQFSELRIGSMQRLADAIRQKPALYVKARTCAAALPGIRSGVTRALRNLGEIVPSARFPPVTLLVGRGTTGGVTTPDGVVIGLETLCNADWMQADVTERFVHLIAHEYVHVQQHGAAVEVPAPTLLYQTLLEGGAEYVGELISGQAANSHLQRWTAGRECALEREFAAQRDSTDLSRWLYNGPGDDTRRGDLGYWVGQRIARAYVNRADDRQKAIAELLDVRPETAEALFSASGWTPACVPGSTAAR